MRAIDQLKELEASLSPVELDGINELKAGFALQLGDLNLAELAREQREVEDLVLRFGEELAAKRAEFEILLARYSACAEAQRARALRAEAASRGEWSTGTSRH